MRAEEESISADELDMYLQSIKESEKKGDLNALREILKKVVIGYVPEEEIVDVVYRQKNN